MKTAASILPTVLVATTLMLLAVLALLSLSDIEALLSHGRHARRQRQAWLEAAFLLYERDSSLFGRLDETGAFTLFEDDPASVVTLSRSYWGLYELVRAQTDEGKSRATRLMGSAYESPRRAALYVCDEGRALTLAGKSNLKGTAWLPPAGLLYGQVQSDFYQGDEVPAGDIRPSSDHFPPLNEGVLDSLASLHAPGEGMMQNEMQNSFHEPTVYLSAENLSGATLHGNIVVRSAGQVRVDSTSRLEDILIVAPDVRIGEGFGGSLQIVASDSVIVGRNVRLKYPSGIVIPEGSANSYIEIGEGSEVNGYTILRTAAEIPPDQRMPHYLQAETSRVRGLVWIDGIAQVQGGVTGSLYLRQANYYAPEGYYASLLYNARVYGATAMAFPVWMESDYRKKSVKWLD